MSIFYEQHFTNGLRGREFAPFLAERLTRSGYYVFVREFSSKAEPISRFVLIVVEISKERMRIFESALGDRMLHPV